MFSIRISDLKDNILEKTGFVLNQSQTKRKRAYEIEAFQDYKLRVIVPVPITGWNHISFNLHEDYYQKKCTHWHIPEPRLKINTESKYRLYWHRAGRRAWFENLKETLVFSIACAANLKNCKSCKTLWLRVIMIEYGNDRSEKKRSEISVPFIVNQTDE